MGGVFLSASSFAINTLSTVAPDPLVDPTEFKRSGQKGELVVRVDIG